MNHVQPIVGLIRALMGHGADMIGLAALGSYIVDMVKRTQDEDSR